jgi:hypothetical protein
MRGRSLPALFLGVLSCLLPGPVEAGRPSVAPQSGSALDAASIESAFGRGAACLGRDIDPKGGSAVFRDPYLTYVYPDERLPVPPGARPLTYRQVDAATILVLLGRTGAIPEPLATAAAEAAKRLSEVAPVWRGRGFSNVKRGSRPDGIALDTFCVVGWLNGDEAMAREAAEAIDGDGWIPPGWYEGAEKFRAATDESWCLRLLAATHRLDTASSRVLDRIIAEFRSRAREAPHDRQRLLGLDASRARAREASADAGAFYEAWHLGMVGAEIIDRENEQEIVRARAFVEEAVRAMQGWADAAKDVF